MELFVIEELLFFAEPDPINIPAIIVLLGYDHVQQVENSRNHYPKVDENRVKEVGPDRACAEWLLKNGATVMWKEDGDFLSDYNALPSLEEPSKHIQAVDATNSAISDIGFPHFNGCKYIDEIKLVNCVYLQDPAISLLSVLKKSLNHLEIRSCLNISDKALLDADKLTNLKTLKVGDMSHIKNKTEIIEKLTKALPDCKIDFE